MKKKVIITAIVVVVILAIIIPIVVLGLDRNKITISSELVNENKTEEEIQAEKKRIMEKYTSNEVKKSSRESLEEEKRIIEQKDNKALERQNNLEKILKKYYPQEVENIIIEIKEEIEIRDTKGEVVAVTDAEYKLVDMAINILERKNLEDEEKDVLKEYLAHINSDAKKQNKDELVKRIEEVIK